MLQSLAAHLSVKKKKKNPNRKTLLQKLDSNSFVISKIYNKQHFYCMDQ